MARYTSARQFSWFGATQDQNFTLESHPPVMTTLVLLIGTITLTTSFTGWLWLPICTTMLLFRSHFLIELSAHARSKAIASYCQHMPKIGT